MRQFLRTMFTGADNQSYDLGRVLWGLSTLALLTFEAISVCRGLVFDPMAFSGALSALAIGHGASLKLKGDTEPETK